MFRFFVVKITVFLCIGVFGCFGQTTKQPTNELYEKVIKHYKKQKDSQKIEAAEFLLKNIPLHKGEYCTWVDKSKQPLDYNELSFPDYTLAKEKLKDLSEKGATHKLDTIDDLQKITPALLIENIDLAFSAWRTNPWSKSYDFETFKEYILPYRSTTEPLQNWRDDYKWFYDDIRVNNVGITNPIVVCKSMLVRNKDFNFKFIRKDPLPILGAKHILFRNEGNCHEIANLNIFASRALGIATTFDFVPYWAASSNRHMWNTTIDANGKHIAYDSERLTFITKKRIGKVLRCAFSGQPDALASMVNPNTIPSLIFKKKNIIDVTSEYTEVGGFNYTFEAIEKGYSYLCVFNRGRWEMTDWATINNFVATFKNLGRDVVYLPTTTLDAQQNYAYDPVLLSKEGDKVLLTPDFENTFNCNLSRDNETITEYEEENSTKIEKGVNYHLLYWNKRWIHHSSSIATDNGVDFNAVPSNALFVLITDKTDSYERIFTIDPKNSKITWY